MLQIYKASGFLCSPTLEPHMNYAKMARFVMIKLPASMAWIKQRTAEYRISNRKITKDGIAALCLLN